MVIRGDATEISVLERAGIARPPELLLAVTGLFFSAGAGGTWRELTAAAGQSAAVLDVWLPGQRPAVEPAAGGHGAPATAAPPRPAVPATVSIQAYLDAAAAAGIVHEPRVAAPAVAGQGWTVTESDSLLPTHWDAALIDPATGAVVRTAAFSDTPPLGQIYRYAMVFHFGRLLGWPGQILFAITTIAVTASAYWGYRMWWQRRPRGSGWRPGRAPAGLSWLDCWRGIIAGLGRGMPGRPPVPPGRGMRCWSPPERGAAPSRR